MKLLISMCLILTGVTVTCAQEKRLKIYISADLEGVAGVVSQIQTTTGGRDYQTSRRLMTEEVNAAIAGAYDAGATEVLVSDSHGDMQNIDIELLDKRVRLVRSWPRPLGMMQGIDKTFDAVVFIGYHAGEGEPGAVLSHTFSGREEIKLNGQLVPEAGFNAAIAGEFGVPVVFLSGDQVITEEARRLLGPIETATVKESLGFYTAITIHPEESQRLIREGVKRGIEQRKKFSLYKPTHPVKLEVAYKDLVTAEIVSYLPGVERPRGNTIVFTGRDMIEVSRFKRAIGYLNTIY
jgi:D-amino peptidase